MQARHHIRRLIRPNILLLQLIEAILLVIIKVHDLKHHLEDHVEDIIVTFPGHQLQAAVEAK